MKVEFLDEFRSGGRLFHEGDTLTVEDAFGARMCKNGFAKDVEGKVPTGEQPSAPVRIKPEDVYTDSGV